MLVIDESIIKKVKEGKQFIDEELVLEEWEDFVSGEGLYKISDLGQVKSLSREVKFGWSHRTTKEKILKIHVHRGRLNECSVMLSNKGKQHRERVGKNVLLAFVGPCPEGMECCHEDGNELNNRLGNLRWDTHLENIRDKKKHGTQLFGEKCYNSKLTFEKATEIRNLYATGKYTCDEIAQIFNVSRTRINKVINNYEWKTDKIADNIKEIKDNNRARGERSGMSKLKEKDIIEIKKMIKDKKLTYKEIGHIFSVTEGTIQDIHSERTWKRVGGILCE